MADKPGRGEVIWREPAKWCPYCNSRHMELVSFEMFDDHRGITDMRGNPQREVVLVWRCPNCSQDPNFESEWTHTSVHENAEEHYQCETCGKWFAESLGTFFVVKEPGDEGGETIFLCRECEPEGRQDP